MLLSRHDGKLLQQHQAEQQLELGVGGSVESELVPYELQGEGLPNSAPDGQYYGSLRLELDYCGSPASFASFQRRGRFVGSCSSAAAAGLAEEAEAEDAEPEVGLFGEDLQLELGQQQEEEEQEEQEEEQELTCGICLEERNTAALQPCRHQLCGEPRCPRGFDRRSAMPKHQAPRSCCGRGARLSLPAAV
jgi:hypothetical protein